MKFHLLSLLLISSIIAAPTKNKGNNKSEVKTTPVIQPTQNAQSVSTGNATGSGTGTGTNFGSLAYTTIGSGSNSSGGAAVVQGSIGTGTPIASSGVSYSAGTGGGANYGSVAPNSNYSTSSDYKSTLGTSVNTGGGGSFGFANDKLGISVSYGGALSRDPTTGTILSGGLNIDIGGTNGVNKDINLGGTIKLPAKKY
ncbi:hypothetical protein K502DRAFT_325130 [Neoconidiobolus thromboides FSU 785]|nr:hypothetical protein K502DRAFT_325130 [Neoconidiobolus thromboides FSU 785]